MKTKMNLFKIIPLLVVASTVCGCSSYSSGRKESHGVTDVYDNEREDSMKSNVKFTYQDLYNNYIYDTDNFPAKGNSMMLIIPVWFTDSSSYITGDREAVRNDIYSTFFGNETDTGWRSVSGYYKQESYNQLNISGTVTPWWECKYTANQITNTDATSKLVKEAVEWFSKNNSDISSFDTDKDGYIDGVALIYGAPDYSTYSSVSGGRWSENMWAYSYWIQEPTQIGKVIPNTYMWASYDFMYDSTTPKNGPFGYGDCSHCSVDAHTYIHEMGHILGLQDYYDYAINDSVLVAGYEAAGVFSMQDNNIGGHDPFSKIALGWSKPILVSETCTITIKPNQSSGDVILLSPNFTGSPFDEYILIELYTPTGLNQFDSRYAYFNNISYKGPTSSGCRVWHVDARLGSPTYNERTRNYYYPDTSTVGTDPTIETKNGFEHVISNTSKSRSTEGYYSPIPEFVNYRLLQLIRANKTDDYRCGDNLTAANLFTTGNTFSMDIYKKVFYNEGKLNTKADLGYSVHFDSVSADYATLTITKI